MPTSSKAHESPNADVFGLQGSQSRMLSGSNYHAPKFDYVKQNILVARAK